MEIMVILFLHLLMNLLIQYLNQNFISFLPRRFMLFLIQLRHLLPQDFLILLLQFCLQHKLKLIIQLSLLLLHNLKLIIQLSLLLQTKLEDYPCLFCLYQVLHEDDFKLILVNFHYLFNNIDYP